MKSWTKSKWPSAPSRKSTPSRRARATPLLLAAFALAAVGCRSEAPESAAPSMEIRSYEIALETPTPGWSLQPIAAYRTADAYWCLHQLSGPQGMAAQVISRATGRIAFQDDRLELPTRHFVLGKTWAWTSNPEVEFPGSLADFQAALGDAEALTLIPTPSP